jgi:hypothetical protein
MPRLLPARPNLGHLKRQAKELLIAYNAGDSAAQTLFAQHLPTTKRSTRFVVLAHALLVVAREYGFASWPKLKHHVETIVDTQPRHVLSQGNLTVEETKQTTQQRIASIAERLINAARLHQFEQLFAALKIAKRDLESVRAYLLNHHLHAVLIDALLVSVAHSNARLRFWGAQAMDHFADQRCGEALQRLLNDPVPRVRWAALHSLQCAECKQTPLPTVGDIVATIIELALHDPSIKVRRVATYELGRVCANDSRAWIALQAIQAHATDQGMLRIAQHAATALTKGAPKKG